jgi:hypothetical protein
VPGVTAAADKNTGGKVDAISISSRPCGADRPNPPLLSEISQASRLGFAA